MIFEDAFDRLIRHEGGYVNNPSDPGGETKWGISKRAFPNLNIAALTRVDAREIYKTFFWAPLEASTMPSSVAFQVFDFAVNSGIDTAIRYLQRALKVADDGHFGPISRFALNTTSETDILMRFNAERLDYMTRLSNWPDAGRGWARRIALNLRYGADDS